jgi:GLPGLI family protein
MVEIRKSMSPNDTNSTFLGVNIVDEYKKIVDFNCQKAIVTRKVNGITKETICWFTKDIPPYNTQNDPNLKSIPGFLMQYSLLESGISMTMTVKLVMKLPIENSYFEIPAGYQVVSEKELNNILMVMQSN